MGSIFTYNGPYGLYVKQGKVNASLPEGKTAEDISLEEAIELLEAKLSSKKTKKKKGVTSKKTVKSKSKVKTTSKTKTPSTTKSGRLRASAVRVIKASND